MTRFLTFLALVLSVIGLAGAPALAGSKDAVKVSGGKGAAAAEQVVVGQFTVAFLIERNDNAQARGGLMGSGFGGKSTVRSTLLGVETAQMQQVADAAYTDFVAQLAAQGFTVVERDALAAHTAAFGEAEAYQEVKASVGKDDRAQALLVGASQTGLRVLDADFLMNGMAQMGMRQNAWKLGAAMQEYTKQTGVRVVNVIYYVNFADSDEYAGGTTSRVKVEGSLGMAPEATRVSMTGSRNTPTVLTLKQPIGVGGDFFVKQDTMGGGEKAVRAASRVIGVLGGMGSNSLKKFSFTAQPGAYPDAAIEASVAANALFAKELAALR